MASITGREEEGWRERHRLRGPSVLSAVNGGCLPARETGTWPGEVTRYGSNQVPPATEMEQGGPQRKFCGSNDGEPTCPGAKDNPV